MKLSGATRSFVLIGQKGEFFLEQKRKGVNVAAAGWALAEPIVTGLGLTLWDVRYVKEGQNRYRICFSREDTEYEYDIDAASGKVLRKQIDDEDE